MLEKQDTFLRRLRCRGAPAPGSSLPPPPPPPPPPPAEPRFPGILPGTAAAAGWRAPRLLRAFLLLLLGVPLTAAAAARGGCLCARGLLPWPARRLLLLLLASLLPSPCRAPSLRRIRAPAAEGRRKEARGWRSLHGAWRRLRGAQRRDGAAPPPAGLPRRAPTRPRGPRRFGAGLWVQAAREAPPDPGWKFQTRDEGEVPPERPGPRLPPGCPGLEVLVSCSAKGWREAL